MESNDHVQGGLDEQQDNEPVNLMFEGREAFIEKITRASKTRGHFHRVAALEDSQAEPGAKPVLPHSVVRGSAATNTRRFAGTGANAKAEATANPTKASPAKNTNATESTNSYQTIKDRLARLASEAKEWAQGVYLQQKTQRSEKWLEQKKITHQQRDIRQRQKAAELGYLKAKASAQRSTSPPRRSQQAQGGRNDRPPVRQQNTRGHGDRPQIQRQRADRNSQLRLDRDRREQLARLLEKRLKARKQTWISNFLSRLKEEEAKKESEQRSLLDRISHAQRQRRFRNEQVALDQAYQEERKKMDRAYKALYDRYDKQVKQVRTVKDKAQKNQKGRGRSNDRRNQRAGQRRSQPRDDIAKRMQARAKRKYREDRMRLEKTYRQRRILLQRKYNQRRGGVRRRGIVALLRRRYTQRDRIRRLRFNRVRLFRRRQLIRRRDQQVRLNRRRFIFRRNRQINVNRRRQVQRLRVNRQRRIRRQNQQRRIRTDRRRRVQRDVRRRRVQRDVRRRQQRVRQTRRRQADNHRRARAAQHRRREDHARRRRR